MQDWNFKDKFNSSYYTFKVACMVQIKLFFMNWFYYNLIILIEQCKIPYKNLDKALLFSRNYILSLKIWKPWRASTTLQFNTFCWNFAHVFYLPMSTKGCAGFLLFCLDLKLFAKIKKVVSAFCTLIFYIFINNSRSK